MRFMTRCSESELTIGPTRNVRKRTMELLADATACACEKVGDSIVSC